MRPKFRIGLVQMSMFRRCRKKTWKRRSRAFGRRRGRGAQIVCLQELFRSQYFCREEDAARFELAEPIPGPTTDLHGPDCAGDGHGGGGESVRAARGGRLSQHRGGAGCRRRRSWESTGRCIFPDDPGYYEKFYFTPGDLGFRNFDTAFGRIGVLVCWDQWYPEAARLTALQGAEILFYPTAIGWHPREKEREGAAQLDAWKSVQRGHAIANGVYVAAVNRTGLEGTAQDGLEFWGHSFVADPFGVVVAEAAGGEEQTLVVECDPARTEEVRRNWPFFRDRRIDAYGGLTARWLA